MSSEIVYCVILLALLSQTTSGFELSNQMNHLHGIDQKISEHYEELMFLADKAEEAVRNEIVKKNQNLLLGFVSAILASVITNMGVNYDKRDDIRYHELMQQIGRDAVFGGLALSNWFSIREIPEVDFCSNFRAHFERMKDWNNGYSVRAFGIRLKMDIEHLFSPLTHEGALLFDGIESLMQILTDRSKIIQSYTYYNYI
nr:uncharacterized protein LOC121132348 isoform X2 [Lepeophtheirus salmonis]